MRALETHALGVLVDTRMIALPLRELLRDHAIALALHHGDVRGIATQRHLARRQRDVQPAGEQHRDDNTHDARTPRAGQRRDECTERVSRTGVRGRAGDEPGGDRHDGPPATEHAVQKAPVAEAVKRARRQVPRGVDDECEPDATDDAPAERAVSHEREQRGADDELERDTGHRDREARREARLDELIADPATCEPEQLDLEIRGAGGERDAAVPDELVTDEAEPARRERDACQQSSQPEGFLVHGGCRVIIQPMGRLALAVIVVGGAAGPAFAGPSRNVHVESEPAGATVYLDEVEKGPVCDTTPCTFSAPLGKHALILRLDKYQPEFLEIDVTKGKRPLDNTVKLKSALGTIVVDSPKGAAVRVDGVDSGKAPTRISVSSSEGHSVVVTLNGKTVFEEFVEVPIGDEYNVKVRVAAAPAATPPTGERAEEEEGGGEGSDQPPREDKKPKSQFISAALAVDVGFRNFEYTNPTTTNPPLNPENEVQTIVGPAIEFWPGRLLGIRFLRGLSLFGRAEVSPLGQNVTGKLITGSVKTSWVSYEGSLRERLTFGDFGVEASGGYVLDSFTFTGNPDDLMKLPDATYSSVRLGLKAAYNPGKLEIYIAGENRIVVAGGEIQKRFTRAHADGLRGALGFVYEIKPWLWVRLEGVYMRYAWTFSSEPSDMYQAKGAVDSVKYISALAGIAF